LKGLRAWVVPPSAGFLPTLARELLGRHGRDLSRVTVLLPTRRSVHYLRYYLVREARGPLWLPRIQAFSDWVNELAVRLDPRPVILPAERAWWLFRIASGRPGFEKIGDSFDRFIPWGLKFAEVLEEFLREGVTPRDLLEPPEGIPPEARAFLGHLAEISRGYREALRRAGVTTPAERLRTVAEGLSEVFSPEGPVYLAGFAALTAAERKIFREILSAGGEIFFEFDPEGEVPEFLEEV